MPHVKCRSVAVEMELKKKDHFVVCNRVCLIESKKKYTVFSFGLYILCVVFCRFVRRGKWAKRYEAQFCDIYFSRTGIHPLHREISDLVSGNFGLVSKFLSFSVSEKKGAHVPIFCFVLL